jgi:formamidopyrimidine-DNA glycosylase
LPELPEVEVVRRGLDRWVTGRTIATVDVLHPRAVRRHDAGSADLSARLIGRTVRAASRRGKYLWLPLEPGGDALVAHLGMSGQLLLQPPAAPDETHLRVRLTFTDGGRELRFVDQRTFGGLAVEELVEDDRGGHVPSSVAHIARDPLDPDFDDAAFVAALRRRRTGLKRALLDQSLVSGIGNIYADEALFLAGIRPRRQAARLNRAELTRLRAALIKVLRQAIKLGGSSVSDYVDADGVRGFFQLRHKVYQRTGQPCLVCGTPIQRITLAGRSTHFCPNCQR